MCRVISVNNTADEKRAADILPHNCILEDRKKLSVSGVSDVGSFDEQNVTAVTGMGELTVRGEGLHITKLSLDTGELCVEGRISSLSYAEVLPEKGGFFSRVFR